MSNIKTFEIFSFLDDDKDDDDILKKIILNIQYQRTKLEVTKNDGRSSPHSSDDIILSVTTTNGYDIEVTQSDIHEDDNNYYIKCNNIKLDCSKKLIKKLYDILEKSYTLDIKEKNLPPKEELRKKLGIGRK